MRCHHALALSLLVGSAGCGGTDIVDAWKDPAARLEFPADLVRSGFVSNVMPAGPVRVLSQDGRPVRGALVEFSIDGGGELVGPTAYSDDDGYASARGWRLGPEPGEQRLVAETGDLSAVATVQVSLPPDPKFNIRLYYITDEGLFAQDKLAIIRAALRWEALVLGDLPDVSVPATFPENCSGVPTDLRGTPLDDLLVLIVVGRIQGAAARTFICARRPGGGLPSVVGIQLDPDKANATDGIEATMAHELGHALGIGTLWSASLVDYNGDLRFVGRFATAAYQLAAGPGAGGGYFGVPVETSGGAGVARVHWKETVFVQELLTPFPNAGREPISAISAGALRDLGYVVDDTRAEPYAHAPLPAPGEMLSPRPASPPGRRDRPAWRGSTPQTGRHHPASR